MDNNLGVIGWVKEVSRNLDLNLNQNRRGGLGLESPLQGIEKFEIWKVRESIIRIVK